MPAAVLPMFWTRPEPHIDHVPSELHVTSPSVQAPSVVLYAARVLDGAGGIVADFAEVEKVVGWQRDPWGVVVGVPVAFVYDPVEFAGVEGAP